MKDKKVRVRIVANRSREVAWAKGKIGGSFEVFGLEFDDQELVGFLDLNLVKGQVAQELGKLLFVDYIFDLEDPQARSVGRLVV